MLLVAVLAVASLTSLPAPVRGLTYTWDNSSGDGLWTTPANWSANVVPGVNDTAAFDVSNVTDATISANVSVRGVLILAGYSGTITQSAGTLTVGVDDFSQAGGTFAGGTTAITINDAFSLSGGSFTSTSATLTVLGAFTHSGGTFAHGGGTVAFSTNSATIDVSTSLAFNSVSFLSGTKTIAAGDTLDVGGTLNLVGGVVNTGTLAAHGDISVQSTFTSGGTATLLINGTANQTMTGFHNVAVNGDLPVVVINKAVSGDLTLAGSLRTSRNWTYTAVAGSFTTTGTTVAFSGGTITGDHTLTNVDIRGGTITIAAGTTVTVGGSLNLVTGALNQGGATGTLAAHGDISVQSTFTSGGTATLLINGTANQTMTGFHNVAVNGDLPVVVINKAVSGDLTLAGSLRTSRNWTYTAVAGSFTTTGTTVAFSGGTITGDHTLTNVDIRGGTITIAAGTTVTVGGSLNLVTGALNQGGATGTLAAHGDISVQSTFTSGGTATLLINGTANQTMTGFHNVAVNGDLPVVVINKAVSGDLTLAGSLRTSRNWTYTAVAGSFTTTGTTVAFSGGTITGDHTLTNVDIRGGTITIAAGTTVTVGGSLNLVTGALNQGGATGTLAAHGDISVQSTFTSGGTATLLINGTANQTMTGFHNVAVNGDLPVVVINKAVSGDLTLAGSLRTSRNWTYTAVAGSFTTTGTTVAFSGGTITGDHTLTNVDIRGGTITIAAGTTVTVGGSLNLVTGALNQGGATGTLAAHGDIFARIGFTSGGSGTLLINGTANQTFDGDHTQATGALPNVDINKPSGSLTLTDILRTGRNWTYTAAPGGLVVTGSTVVFVANPGTIITGNHTLNNVEIRGNVTIAAGTTLIATGTTELFSGSVNTGTLAAHGDIFARIGFTSGGSGTLLINGTANQTFDGDHTQATGALPNVDINKPSGSLTLTDILRTGRNWTYTAAPGGLVVTGSTVVFVANPGTIITGNHTLNNVEIRGNVTIAAGTTLIATGTTELFSGSVNTGTLAAHGDIFARIGFTSGGSGTLLINGTANQTFDGDHTQATGALPNVDINKPSGSLTLTDILRTGRNWTYTAAPGGLVVTGSTVVFFANPGTIITGNHTLNNVEIRGNVTIAAGTTLIATGTTELFSGSVNTGTLAAHGDIFARIGFTSGGSGTLLINGTANQTFDGDHTQATGALPNVDINKPSGSLTLTDILRTGRNWTYTAAPGGLVVTGSTVVFNGTLTISGSHALNNVELRSGDVTVTVGDTMTVAGLLTLTDGNLEGGTVAALGDISLAANYDGESGTLRIAGTVDQTFTGAAGPSSDMANVVIDKSSGTLHLVGDIRLTTSSWTWLQGTVDGGTSTVTFDSTVTISGTHTLNNVVLTGGAHTVGSGMPTAGGTLTLDNGTIDGGTFGATGAIDQLPTFDGGSGTLHIIGASMQTFTGSATPGVGDLPNVVINKSAGTLFLVGTLRMNGANWTHVAGTVDGGASLLEVAGTSTLAAAGMTFNDLTVRGGTTTLAQDLNVGGDLLIAAGTLNGAGQTIAVAGDVTVDGSLIPGTGLLVMHGAAPQVLGGAAANIGLHDLTVNNLAGVTITTDVSTAGTLTLNGPLDISSQTLGIAQAIAGTPVDLVGDPASSLVITGTGAGIVIPASLPALANLTLDNPNGAAISAPLMVGSLLTLTDGVLDAGGWVVIIDPAASVVRTAGHVSGGLQKTIPTGSGVSATFEIGDATIYAPLTLTFGTVSTSGEVTASTTGSEHPGIGASVIDPTADVNRWWSVANSGTVFDTVDAAFSWSPSDLDVGADPNAFIVAKWDGSWVLPVASGQGPTSITAVGMTSFSEFAVGEVQSNQSGLPDTAGTEVADLDLALRAALVSTALLVLVAIVYGLTRRRGTAPTADRG